MVLFYGFVARASRLTQTCAHSLDFVDLHSCFFIQKERKRKKKMVDRNDIYFISAASSALFCLSKHNCKYMIEGQKLQGNSVYSVEVELLL